MKPRAASQTRFSKRWLYYKKLFLLLFFNVSPRYLQCFWKALSAPATEHGSWARQLFRQKQPTINPRVTRKFTRHPIQERNLPMTTLHFKKNHLNQQEKPQTLSNPWAKRVTQQRNSTFPFTARQDSAAFAPPCPASGPATLRGGDGTRRTPVTAPLRETPALPPRGDPDGAARPGDGTGRTGEPRGRGAAVTHPRAATRPPPTDGARRPPLGAHRGAPARRR